MCLLYVSTDTDFSMSDDRPNSEVVGRYCLGEARAAEVAEVEAWRDEDASHRSELERIQAALLRLDMHLTPNEIAAGVAAIVNAALGDGRSLSVRGMTQTVNEFRSRRRPGVEKLPSADVQPRVSLGTRTLLGALGMVTVIAMAIGLFRLGRDQNAVTTYVYTTGATQAALFRLSDGTQVMLSPGTTLRLADFSAAKRTVILDKGEGFFDVSQLSGVPFIVRSGRIETRVLGTSFLMRRSGNDGRVHVAVASGKVAVTGAALRDSPLLLTAGRIGDVTDSIAHVSAVVDDAPEMAWEDGQMVFRHAPVSQVLAGLTRWYGYQFRCSDSTVSQLRVTVGMSTRSSTAALAKLEQILGVNLTVVGDTVTLTPHAARTVQKLPRTRTYDVWIPYREVGR